jgi:hypothetical protein
MSTKAPMADATGGRIGPPATDGDGAFQTDHGSEKSGDH